MIVLLILNYLNLLIAISSYRPWKNSPISSIWGQFEFQKRWTFWFPNAQNLNPQLFDILPTAWTCFLDAILSRIKKIDEKRFSYFDPCPDTHTCVIKSGRKKCWFFGRFCVCTKWITPSRKNSVFWYFSHSDLSLTQF